TGLVAGTLAGPLTPSDVAAGTQQAATDWGMRTFFFVTIGLVITHVVRSTRSSLDRELEDLRLGAELSGAATRGELVLEYQPIVELRSGDVIAAEALVRWNHPERGRILPDQFIPQSEASGQIIALGGWVIDEACRHLSSWLAGPVAPERRFRVSVNVSPRQLEEGDLVAVVERALRRHHIPPDRLVVEVTETEAVVEQASARRQLQRLQDLGVLVAVDDFGTGYSSLAQLRELPVDVVKIDRAFVQRLGRDGREDDRRIAAGIIDLSHDLGMSVVAEGIETDLQVATLLELGCTKGQGFRFAPSLPVEALTARLQSDTPVAKRKPTPPAERQLDVTRSGWIRWVLHAPDAVGQHQARTKALAALFVAGACMALTTNALDPTRDVNSMIAAAVGASGFPTAFVLLKAGGRLPPWMIHAFLVAGTLVVSIGALLSNDAGLTVATASLYTWVVLYAAAFYDWPVAAAHFGVVAAGMTTVLSMTDTTKPVGVLVMLLGSAAVGAGVVGWLARQLRAIASTDLLTGVPNRQAFEALLPREISRADRDGTPLCLAVIDVDGFKEINDTYGHQAGDRILAALPSQWMPALRVSDLLARIGGDEFVVLLPDCHLNDAVVVLERMRSTCSTGCSIGVAAYGEGETPDRLMARADEALYEAKRAGAGRVVAADAHLVDPEPVALAR
ncbi:MAG TPA: GGDEF domain-containing protein, partial [Acidimicrobiales bacterium]|nr:GGDEF domain-containing protein [Acidimicrobiales bacterium]